jgi:anti-sigma B factor antagonist
MSSKELAFELLSDATPNQHVYRLKGPVVLNNMFAFQAALRTESTNTTILDMTEVPYIDSAALGVLTNAYVTHQRQGRRMLLVGVTERVQDLFKMTSLHKLFEIFPTVESARLAAGRAA